MPRGAAPRALLGVFALIIAFAVAIVPLVDARPKDKNNGGRDAVAEATVAPAEDAAASENASQTTTNNDANERTLIQSDADGDYIPDAMDNCASVQNPDQADSDGDGAGDACPIYTDYDGDGVPDKEDNCPNIATGDFADRDGDGVGDPCDKSPDGVEPEPEPLPEYLAEDDPNATEYVEPVSGANEDGRSIEREGKSRSKQRSRTETVDATITTGVDGAEEAQVEGGSDGQVITEGPNAQPYEPSGRDNPRINEELIAEAAATGELYAEPQPPPEPQRAWDETAINGSWRPVVRIDAGTGGNSQVESRSAETKTAKKGRNSKQKARKQADGEAGDNRFARGWMRGALFLQDDTAEDAEEGDGASGGTSPVPVENGLVITADSGDASVAETDNPPARMTDAAQDAERETGDGTPPAKSPTRSAKAHKQRAGKKDGSRRDGSSRAAAAPSRTKNTDTAERSNGNGAKRVTQQNNAKNARQGKRTRTEQAKQNQERRNGSPQDWLNDRFFEGGQAQDWSDEITISGTDEQEIYLTQREGSGTGKRHGFSYAIPVESDGTYLVRLYFAEATYTEPGERIFSVFAEGDALIESLDIVAEAGPETSLVKQAEVRVDDGEINLAFSATEGAPTVAAIEVLK